MSTNESTNCEQDCSTPSTESKHLQEMMALAEKEGRTNELYLLNFPK